MLLQAGDADLRAGVNLFLSRAHADKPLVRSIAVQLRALGYDATMDEDEIVLGDRILARVEDAITRADYLILVLSEAAVKSTWVDEEWRTKFEQQMSDGRVEVIPVILGYEANSPPILRGRLHFSGHRLKVLRDAAPAIDAAIREHERRRSLTGLGHEPKRALIESPGVANLRKEFPRRSISGRLNCLTGRCQSEATRETRPTGRTPLDLPRALRGTGSHCKALPLCKYRLSRVDDRRQNLASRGARLIHLRPESGETPSVDETTVFLHR
jgi:TIR domain